MLCTTELGLRCITRKSKTGSIVGALDSPVEERGGDVFERRMLLPPKVVLDSAVDALE